MATVRIPAPLRALTNNARVVQASGGTLVEVVDDLERQFPGLRARILDGDGAVHAFVNIFVNDEDIRFLQGLATPLAEQADVSIIPAMAGGVLAEGGVRGGTPRVRPPSVPGAGR